MATKLDEHPNKVHNGGDIGDNIPTYKWFEKWVRQIRASQIRHPESRHKFTEWIRRRGRTIVVPASTVKEDIASPNNQFTNTTDHDHDEYPSSGQINNHEEIPCRSGNRRHDEEALSNPAEPEPTIIEPPILGTESGTEQPSNEQPRVEDNDTPREIETPAPQPTALQPARPGLVARYTEMENGFYVALLHPIPPNIYSQWKESWEVNVKTRLANMELTPQFTNVELRMAGPSSQGPTDDTTMLPTVIVMCKAADNKMITQSLAPLIEREFAPVRFKAISGIRWASEEIDDEHVDSNYSSSPLPTQLDTMLLSTIDPATMRWHVTDHARPSLVGVAMFTEALVDGNSPRLSLRTIGGLIRVGDSIMALTVAHTNSKQPTVVFNPRHKPGDLSGQIEAAQWSVDESQTPSSTAVADGQDWMIFKPTRNLYLPNSFQLPDSTERQFVDGYEKSVDISNGDVWVCGGVTGVQQGYLLSTSSVLTYGNSEFSVLSIALSYPLADGDSGSWVVKSGKLCGYIIARLGQMRWAYILPIDAAFDSIQAYLLSTTGSKGKISLPTQEEIKLARQKIAIDTQDISSEHQFANISQPETAIVNDRIEITQNRPGVSSGSTTVGFTGIDQQPLSDSHKLVKVTRNTPALNGAVNLSSPPPPAYFTRSRWNTQPSGRNREELRERRIISQTSWSSFLKKLTTIREGPSSPHQSSLAKFVVMWESCSKRQKHWLWTSLILSIVFTVTISFAVADSLPSPGYVTFIIVFIIDSVFLCSVLWLSWAGVIRKHWPSNQDMLANRRPQELELEEMGAGQYRGDRRLDF